MIRRRGMISEVLGAGYALTLTLSRKERELAGGCWPLPICCLLGFHPHPGPLPEGEGIGRRVLSGSALTLTLTLSLRERGFQGLACLNWDGCGSKIGCVPYHTGRAE